MKFNEVLISENETIHRAAERLEKVRCRVLYVTRNKKLVASLSDGDIRRSVMNNADVNKPIKSIANYNPLCFLVYDPQILAAKFKESDIHSIPIINYNGEIVEIVFRNGVRLKHSRHLSCQVVMMAGGKGTRLYPYTQILPKALVPIGETPISERIFNNFGGFGCKDFYMIVNHKKEMIEAYYGVNKFPYSITMIEEKKPLGTGGGLYLLKDKIKDDFFLTNCDIIIDADYDEIYKKHKEKENYITIVVANYSHEVPYGVIVDNEDDMDIYEGISEKPKLRFKINTGMYVVSEKLIEEMPKNQNFAFPWLIDFFKNKGKKIGLYTVEETAYMDMGQIEALEDMKRKLGVI